MWPRFWSKSRVTIVHSSFGEPFDQASARCQELFHRVYRSVPRSTKWPQGSGVSLAIKNRNWKENVTTSCTVHRIFMILKSVLFWFSIQKGRCKNDLMVYWFSCWSFSLERGVQFLCKHQIILPIALFLLKKVMEYKPFSFCVQWRYKDCDATTRHRYYPKTIPNWVLLGTLKNKPFQHCYSCKNIKFRIGKRNISLVPKINKN